MYNTKLFVKTQMQNRFRLLAVLSLQVFVAVKKLLVYIALLAATKEWD